MSVHALTLSHKPHNSNKLARFQPVARTFFDNGLIYLRQKEADEVVIHTLFLHKNFPGACHVGLGVTAQITGKMLTAHNLSTVDVISVKDGNDLYSRLASGLVNTVSHVVIHAPFIDGPTIDNFVRTWPRIQFAVLCHSNVGFLQVDPGAVKFIRSHICTERMFGNFTLAGNSRKFCNSVRGAFQAPCAYLPNLYYLTGHENVDRPLWHGGTLRIGIFGATRQLKNILTASWAAVEIAARTRAITEIWLSGGREEGAGSVLASIREMVAGMHNVTVRSSGWQPWGAFRETIRHMHLLMQPSYTESFNGVTADGVAEGVPSVVSPAIDWVPRNWIANPDNTAEIADVGLRLLRDRKAARKGLAALRKHNSDGLRAWAEYYRLLSSPAGMA